MTEPGKDHVDGAPMTDEGIPEANDAKQDGQIASPEEQIAGETSD